MLGHKNWEENLFLKQSLWVMAQHHLNFMVQKIVLTGHLQCLLPLRTLFEYSLCKRSPKAIATLETDLWKRPYLEEENITCSSALQAALLFSLGSASLGGIPLMLLFYAFFFFLQHERKSCFMCSVEFISSFKVLLLILSCNRLYELAFKLLG